MQLANTEGLPFTGPGSHWLQVAVSAMTLAINPEAAGKL